MNISHETGTVGFLNEQKSDLIWKKQQGTWQQNILYSTHVIIRPILQGSGG